MKPPHAVLRARIVLYGIGNPENGATVRCIVHRPEGTGPYIYNSEVIQIKVQVLPEP